MCIQGLKQFSVLREPSSYSKSREAWLELRAKTQNVAAVDARWLNADPKKSNASLLNTWNVSQPCFLWHHACKLLEPGPALVSNVEIWPGVGADTIIRRSKEPHSTWVLVLP